MKHEVYGAIVRAINEGTLNEPFKAEDFKNACPGFADNTYNVFLHKHARGNPGNVSILFERVAPSTFRCIRPFKYGFTEHSSSNITEKSKTELISSFARSTEVLDPLPQKTEKIVRYIKEAEKKINWVIDSTDVQQSVRKTLSKSLLNLEWAIQELDQRD